MVTLCGEKALDVLKQARAKLKTWPLRMARRGPLYFVLECEERKDCLGSSTVVQEGKTCGSCGRVASRVVKGPTYLKPGLRTGPMFSTRRTFGSAAMGEWMFPLEFVTRDLSSLMKKAGLKGVGLEPCLHEKKS